MTYEEKSKLEEGDILRNIGSEGSYIIIQRYPHIIAVRTLLVEIPDEWEKYEQS